MARKFVGSHVTFNENAQVDHDTSGYVMLLFYRCDGLVLCFRRGYCVPRNRYQFAGSRRLGDDADLLRQLFHAGVGEAG